MGKCDMKIAFVFGIILPYRTAFFQRLSQIYNVDFLLKSIEETNNEEAETLSYKRYRCCTLPFLKRYGSSGYGHPSLPIDLGFDLFKKNYDLIISKGIGTFATYISFLASMILRTPFIIWDETWYYPPTLARRIVLTFTKIMLRYTEAIVVPGSKSREFFVSLGVEPHKIFVSPNACRKQHVDPETTKALRKRIGLENKRIVVLYFGRLIERKGCQYLISAFVQLQKEFHDLSLVIAGDGPYKNKLKDICQMLKAKNVHFLGYIKEEEKPSVYFLSNVFVVPSIRTPINAEIWGIVINEAMSLGKPIIATDAVGAAYDLIKDGANGFIVQERNVCELYLSIKKILSDEDMATRMGECSRTLINKNFSIDNMLLGFIKAIKFALGKYRKQRSWD
jgi:glycosyltransferase involved in cell wall biosynthesis